VGQTERREGRTHALLKGVKQVFETVAPAQFIGAMAGHHAAKVSDHLGMKHPCKFGHRDLMRALGGHLQQA